VADPGFDLKGGVDIVFAGCAPYGSASAKVKSWNRLHSSLVQLEIQQLPQGEVIIWENEM